MTVTRIKRTTPQAQKYDAARSSALADDSVTKKEAMKLRKLALVDLKASTKPAATSSWYSKDFSTLQGKAADPTSTRYVSSVSAEFSTRARHHEAGTALMKLLASRQNTLSPELKNVDTTGTIEVGTTMQRGVWLRVPIKDRAMFSETTEAAKALFSTEPSLRRFGDIWVIA